MKKKVWIVKYYWVSGFPSDLQTAANNAAKSWMNASSKLTLTYNNSGTVA